ncbi:uncharacterized protein BT62DRAFT_935633 [Guyanagaster necrorhizus]|uniref:Uncharacterized protein n=1 Tax=Guyanagaster necrorhizus TaxID=856835 RepID=A0A9P7VLP0_9AGAR|nr:uncharacterized protein BT62DRAFT_935633 [Guyanagaster necrorhizus MCA 3950]KAG7442907.1 hypothetical protein BT62DRAFT_935633 [Guyanagaster necrorhizus MCA 3950]
MPLDARRSLPSISSARCSKDATLLLSFSLKRTDLPCGYPSLGVQLLVCLPFGLAVLVRLPLYYFWLLSRLAHLQGSLRCPSSFTETFHASQIDLSLGAFMF